MFDALLTSFRILVTSQSFLQATLGEQQIQLTSVFRFEKIKPSLDNCFLVPSNHVYVQPKTQQNPQGAKPNAWDKAVGQGAGAALPKAGAAGAGKGIGKVICVPHLASACKVTCRGFSCMATHAKPCVFPHVEIWKIPRTLLLQCVRGFLSKHPVAMTTPHQDKFILAIEAAYTTVIGKASSDATRIRNAAL